MSHANTARDRLEWNFLMLMTRLFGELAHGRVERKLKKHQQEKAKGRAVPRRGRT